MNLVWQRLLGRCQRYIWWLGACPSSSVAAPAPGAAMATSGCAFHRWELSVRCVHHALWVRVRSVGHRFL